MSISYFSKLSQEEVELLAMAPANVTVLIAGADNDIDKNETEWASKLVRFRTFTSDERLHDYYELVDARFEGDLNTLVADWSAEESQAKLTASLAQLKDILAKVDDSYSAILKESLRSLAKHVAKASGGFLGMGGITREEGELIDLDMLD
ncbi:MAG: hypothetical protein MRZ79_05665 [Bacteroidia bacterium]|nr:hypothetical protein [Bacteroidia bacterium]